MIKFVSLFVLLISSTYLFAEEQSSEKTRIIGKALESLANIVETYNIELDRKVQFPKLKEAIDTLDEYMRNYEGLARTKMLQIRPLCSDARDTYFESVAPLFNWCVAANSTLDLLIEFVNDPVLTRVERKVLGELSHTLLKKGHDEVHNTKRKLESVIRTMSALRNKLGETTYLIEDDFGPNGYYGKKKIAMETAIAAQNKQRTDVSTVRRTVEPTPNPLEYMVDTFGNVVQTLPWVGPPIRKVMDVFFGFFKIIVGFAKNTLGKVLGLQTAMKNAGIPDEVIEKPDTANFKQQIKAIDVFFEKLKSKMEEAQQISNSIQTDLREDYRNVVAMGGLIEGADKDGEFFEKTRAAFLQSNTNAYVQLGRQCYNYALWHGYKPVVIDRRTRRQTELDTAESYVGVQAAVVDSFLETNPIDTRFVQSLKYARENIFHTMSM